VIIDFHTHIFPRLFRDSREEFFSEEPAFKSLYARPDSRLVGCQELLNHMDREGVEKAVVFGFPWEKSDNFQRHNDYIIESVGRYPERLIGFCCFSPRSPHSVREINRCLESGLSGVGELAIYDTCLSLEEIPGLGEIMQTCQHFDVPILFHTNEPVGHVYPGKAPMSLSEIYNLLKQYPSNRVILAHWGGGLFFYGLMKKEVKDVLKNVWFDTAASPFLYGADVYRIAGEIVGFEKILLGSDYPLLSPRRYLEEMRSIGLPAHSINKISGENAARVLGLTPQE